MASRRPESGPFQLVQYMLKPQGLLLDHLKKLQHERDKLQISKSFRFAFISLAPSQNLDANFDHIGPPSVSCFVLRVLMNKDPTIFSQKAKKTSNCTRRLYITGVSHSRRKFETSSLMTSSNHNTHEQIRSSIHAQERHQCPRFFDVDTLFASLDPTPTPT